MTDDKKKMGVGQIVDQNPGCMLLIMLKKRWAVMNRILKKKDGSWANSKIEFG